MNETPEEISVPQLHALVEGLSSVEEMSPSEELEHYQDVLEQLTAAFENTKSSPDRKPGHR